MDAFIYRGKYNFGVSLYSQIRLWAMSLENHQLTACEPEKGKERQGGKCYVLQDNTMHMDHT